MNKIKTVRTTAAVSIICLMFSIQPASADPATTFEEIRAVLASHDIGVDIMNDITFTDNFAPADIANFASDYTVNSPDNSMHVLDGAGKYNGFVQTSNTIGAISKSISVGQGITMQNFFSGIGGVNGAAISVVDNYSNTGITILANDKFINNEAQGSGGAIACLAGSGDSNVWINPGVQFLNNKSGGRGGAIIFGSVNGRAELVLNTSSGPAILFDGNTDATGPNDISIFNSNGTIYIEGNGEIIMNGGISSADTTASIIKSDAMGTNILTLGPDAVNSRFYGTFNQSEGMTNVYSDNFFAGINNISNGSTLHFFNTALANHLNMASGAILDIRADAANIGQFNTLTLSDLASDGTMNFYSATDGANADKLKILNSAVGNGMVYMTVRPGAVGTATSAGSNGILLIDATGATSIGQNSARFSLNNGAVDIGAYEYRLIQATDKNWYLNAAAVPSGGNGGNGGGNGNGNGQGNGGANGMNINSTAKTAVDMPAIHLAILKAGLNELRKRLGAVRYENTDEPFGAWIRGYGKLVDVDENLKSSMDIYGTEGGLDFGKNMLGGRAIFGIMGGYLYAANMKVRQTNLFDGNGSSSAPNVGLYATWFNKTGWFLDLTGRYFWMDTHMTNVNSSGQPIYWDVDRGFVSLSAETGRKFMIDAPYWMQFGKGCDSAFSLEPKIEVRYSHAGKDKFGTSNLDEVVLGTTESFDTRLALQGSYMADGADSVWMPFIELAVYNEWLGGTDINFAGVDFESSIKGMGFETSLGMNVRLSDSSYMYGDVAGEWGQVFQIYSMNLGIRTKF